MGGFQPIEAYGDVMIANIDPNLKRMGPAGIPSMRWAFIRPA